MKKVIQWSLYASWLVGAMTVSAHPGWGIVVNPTGDILFTDVARTTIWKYRVEGKLEPLVRDSGTHSLQLDEAGQVFWGREEYRNGQGPYNSFWKLTSDGERQQLIAPILTRDWHFGTQGLVDGRGNIYFPSPEGILRRDSEGMTKVFVPNISSAMMTMKLAPENTIYLTDGDKLMKVSSETGQLTRVAAGLLSTPPDDPYFEDGSFNDLLGFDVSKDGTVHIAYMGNRRILRVDRKGQSREIYHAPAPWSPVGVVSHENELYVLETSFVEGRGLEGPRIRRRVDEGRFETLLNLEDQD